MPISALRCGNSFDSGMTPLPGVPADPQRIAGVDRMA
jgi:hypothetical protein